MPMANWFLFSRALAVLIAMAIFPPLAFALFAQRIS